MTPYATGQDAYAAGRWTMDWNEPLWLRIKPINGDQQDHLTAYMASLKEATFLTWKQPTTACP